PANLHCAAARRSARGSASAERTHWAPGGLHRLVAIQPETPLSPNLFLVGEQLGREPLAFADALDFDCRCLDDLFDASESRHELGILAGQHRFALRSALAKEIGAGECPG